MIGDERISKRRRRPSDWSGASDQVRRGLHDDTAIVQAFARHRLTAQSGEGRSGAGEDALRDAVRRFLPTNINLDAVHLPDEATIPLDVTMGELRELRAALRATDDAGGA